MSKPGRIVAKMEVNGEVKEVDLTSLNQLSLEDTIKLFVDTAFDESTGTLEERKASLIYNIQAACHIVGEVLTLRPMKCNNGYTQQFYNNMAKNQATQKSLMAKGVIKFDVQQMKGKGDGQG